MAEPVCPLVAWVGPYPRRRRPWRQSARVVPLSASLPHGRRADAELRWRRELLQPAHREGLALIGVFVDERGERPDGYAAMVEALTRRDVRRVLVPSTDHFAHIPRLAGLGPGAVARHLGAAVLFLAHEDRRAPSIRSRR